MLINVYGLASKGASYQMNVVVVSKKGWKQGFEAAVMLLICAQICVSLCMMCLFFGLEGCVPVCMYACVVF